MNAHARTHTRPTDRPVCPDRWRRRREGRGARSWLLSIKRSGGRTAEAGGSPWTLTSSPADVTLMWERERERELTTLRDRLNFNRLGDGGVGARGGWRGRTDRRKERGNRGWTRSDGDQRRQVSILKRFSYNYFILSYHVWQTIHHIWLPGISVWCHFNAAHD